MIGDTLQTYTYDYFLRTALDRVTDDVDKREGSIIGDTLSISSYQLAEYCLLLYQYVMETYALTATGEYLDYRVAERGISRYLASKAVKRGDFTGVDGLPFAISLDSRFSSINTPQKLVYRAIAAYTDADGKVVPGSYWLECETGGTEGNGYTGELLPVSFISGLASARMGELVVPARDNETDDQLRERFLTAVKSVSFGGNISDYDSKVRSIDGVGELQVYPEWDGGGTVKISVIDAEYNPITEPFRLILQEKIDPENLEGKQGTGIGLAPIGHVVTVTSPTPVKINVEANVKLAPTYTLPVVQKPAEDEIKAYLLELRSQWGIPDIYNQHFVAAYIAKITAALLKVTGISNVTDVKINGQDGDIEFTQNALLQELPVMGSVTLNEI